MTDPVIRRAKPSDLTPVATMWRDSVDSVGIRYSVEDTVEDLRAKLEDNWPRRWEVMVVDGQIGIDAFLALDLKKAILAQIFVAPIAQGQGLGRRLLDIARERMPDGFTLWTDARNERARLFYDSHGLLFEQLKKHPLADHYRAHYRWGPAGG